MAGGAIKKPSVNPREFKLSYIKNEMPRDRIELSTPGFSDQCSTTELPRHYPYIITKINGFENTSSKNYNFSSG